jgi:hypothetical protein
MSTSVSIPLYHSTRNGKKWTIPEELRLQREYELLELSIDHIAYLHNRLPDAIAMKIKKEKFYRSGDRYSFPLCINMNSILMYLALLWFFVFFFV